MLQFQVSLRTALGVSIAHEPRMRTLISLLMLGLASGCTAKDYCAMVAVGQPVPGAAQAVSRDSWCGGHPRRNYVGQMGLSADAGQVYSFGEFVEQHSDMAQCCLFVSDGVVVAKWEGYD